MSLEPRGLSGWLARLVAWWTAPLRPARAYAAAAEIGLLVNVLVLGSAHLLGTSAYWDLPQEDSRVYIMGYRHFLHEAWHWPIFESHTINVPYPKSIAFTDSIPLWAFLNKLIATIVPPWGPFSERAYLGLWHGLMYMLQAAFGLACLRALGQRSRGATILGALFFLATPSWIFRYGHASLSAHFLLLWALNDYLRSPSGAPPSRALRIGSVVQLAVAALINPYHAAMSFGLFVLSLLRSRRLQVIVPSLPLGLATVGAAAFVVGFFAKEAKLAMGGFDLASANVLSPFIPVRGGILGDGKWIANVEATDFQYEGYAYFGIGYLLLVLLFLPRARSLGPLVKRHPVFFVALVAVSIFTLSNHVWWGGHRILVYAFPSSLSWILHQYRVPGRFVWFPMYVVMLVVLSSALGRFTSGWRMLLVPFALVVQLWDAWGDWRYRRHDTSAPYPHQLDLDVWRRLEHQHEQVFIWPSYDCILDGAPYVDRISQEIQYLASERALPMNGVYSARPSRDCAADAASWSTLALRENALYVLLPRARGISDGLERQGATCMQFRFGRVCSTNRAAIEEARSAGALEPIRPPPLVPYGYRITLGAGANPDHLTQGWSWEEPTGRWTAGGTARIDLRLAGDPPSGVALKITGSSIVRCGTRVSQSVDVLLNGVKIGRLDFDEGRNDPDLVRSIPIPDPEELRNVVVVELHPHDIRAPSACGCNSDGRWLGMFVRRVWFE